MHYSTLAVVSLAAVAYAGSDVVEKRQNDPLADQASIISALQEFVSIDPSIYDQLTSAIPSSVYDEIQTAPAAASSILSAAAAGNDPEWADDLPQEVRTFLSTKGAAFQSFVGSISVYASGIVDSVSSAVDAAETDASGFRDSLTAAATSIRDQASSIVDSASSAADSATRTAGGVTRTAGATAGSTSTSTALAAKHTGLVAAGFAGAVGVLGLAIAL
ncbi:MAG: hypothetical protein M1817_001712 [Caeruleum heppii]|nr:MAG: hypothetical protein M1817_001712 [Caeruleum heppii]